MTKSDKKNREIIKRYTGKTFNEISEEDKPFFKKKYEMYKRKGIIKIDDYVVVDCGEYGWVFYPVDD